jgi:hypothetical protein
MKGHTVHEVVTEAVALVAGGGYRVRGVCLVSVVYPGDAERRDVAKGAAGRRACRDCKQCHRAGCARGCKELNGDSVAAGGKDDGV